MKNLSVCIAALTFACGPLTEAATPPPDGQAPLRLYASLENPPPLPYVYMAPIYLNQSGFNSGEPKRFTAPTMADGTAFSITEANGGPVLFAGTIKDHIGDFSSFDPPGEREYVVKAGEHHSVPFRIGMWWFERVNYQGSIDFMIDSRHYVGTMRSPIPMSYGWRDDHHFAFELPALVAQWLSNPSAYARMRQQVRYEAPRDKALWGALEPYREDAPDIVKLIHWGADVIVTQQLSHELLKSQLAYFLYAWPWLKQYLPEQNYRVVRDFATKLWANPIAAGMYAVDETPEHNLLAVKTRIGTTKGAYPPGFSVEPNLLMYAVARRDKDSNAQRYLDAAYRQSEWMIANLDWGAPIVTKGQRVSEWVTITGLTHFLREYPKQAPPGLAAKVAQWADVVLRRSNNMWDFRKLGDGPDDWTPTGPEIAMWNEPGNVVGLPGPLLAAQPYARTPAIGARLRQLAYAHLDNSFGRNPTGRSFWFHGPRDLEGVEYGWYVYLPDAVGRLEDARYRIDGAPKNQHYPYHPQRKAIGWNEGWIQFNTALNNSLAYMAFAGTSIQARMEGDYLLVELTAPLNFDYQKIESAEVAVASSSGDRKMLKLSENGPNSSTLSGKIRIARSSAGTADSGVLSVPPGATVEAEYGGGYLGHRVRVRP